MSNQWPWLSIRLRTEVPIPYMFGLFFRPIFLGNIPRKIWSKIWYSTSILGSWNSHWSISLNSYVWWEATWQRQDSRSLAAYYCTIQNSRGGWKDRVDDSIPTLDASDIIRPSSFRFGILRDQSNPWVMFFFWRSASQSYYHFLETSRST